MSAVALQDRALMDSSRAMKMAPAAGNGDDVQDHTKEAIAQDSADGNDSCNFRLTNFFRSFVDAVAHRTPKGQWEASKGNQAACQPQGYYGRT